MSDWREELLGADPETLEELPDVLPNVAGDPFDDPNIVEEKPDDEVPDDPDNDPEGLTITVPDGDPDPPDIP